MTKSCRSCDGVLEPILDLGQLQLSGYLRDGEPERPAAPLRLCACATCRLVQLADTTPRELLFSRYWYRSGINEVMQAELADVVTQALTRVEIDVGDKVLDIGANDGTLLGCYVKHPVYRIAFEPAENLVETLSYKAEEVYPAYFPDRFKELHKKRYSGRMKIITSIAMVYAVDDLVSFLTAVADLLHPRGVWVVQFQDLAQMLDAVAFDNICHEHLCYFSLQTFAGLLPSFGLEVIDAERRTINGGSLRVTVGHLGQHQISPHVAELLAAEAGCQSWETLERFPWMVSVVKSQIREIVTWCTAQGRTVDLYGASTKANTLLQVCGLTHREVRAAWERSREKIGRKTVATGIPIISEDAGRADPPDALLVGIWQFRDAVIAREQAYLESGGVLILPLPRVEIVTGATVGARVC